MFIKKVLCAIALAAAVMALDPSQIIGSVAKPTQDELQSLSEPYRSSLLALQGNSFFAVKQQIKKRVNVTVTAYSSTPEETDDTPFITATGNYVKEGIVAANFLPFGTRIMIPEVYGAKVFVVDDRMSPRLKYNVDVWMPSKRQALTFGKQYTYIEVIE